MHADLWSPGMIEYENGDKGSLMNSMCDISQFVVFSSTITINASSLAAMFMSDMLLLFGMCSVVVVDDGSTFSHVLLQCVNFLKLTISVYLEATIKIIMRNTITVSQ